MVQARHHARLALRAARVRGAAVASDHLHGHLALEPLVQRRPHHAEAAGAEAAQQPVAAEH
jgi:hypothetical protein